MAIRNDPRLYSGGSEVFDSRPHTRLYIDLMQKEQAKDAAFDEYVRNLNMKVNPAGMRNNEIPFFNEKLKKWQEFGIQNREALRNPRKDGGKASMEFQAGYQDLQNTIERSKSIESLKKPAVEILTDPNKMDRVNKDKLMKALQSTDQNLFMKDPKTGAIIDNPDWRPFNIAEIEFDPKPFEQDKYFKQFEDIKRTELPPVVTKNPKDMTQTEVKTSVFTPEDKDIIATRAVTDYMQNKSFKNLVDNLNPEDYNDFYKQNFGHDIQSKADLAAAYTLKGLQQKVVTTKVEDDVFARQKAMQAIRNADAKELVRLGNSLKKDDAAVNDLWIESAIDKWTEEATKGEPQLYPGAGLGYEIPLNSFLVKALTKDKLSPDKLIVTTDGKYVPVFYKRDGDGNLIIDKNSEIPKVSTYTAPISRDMLKVDMGGRTGVKQMNKEMSAGAQPQYAPQPDWKSRAKPIK